MSNFGKQLDNLLGDERTLISKVLLKLLEDPENESGILLGKELL